MQQQKRTLSEGNIYAFLNRNESGLFDFEIQDTHGNCLKSGVSFGFDFNEKLNIFTASRVRAHHVASLVFNF